MQPDYHIHTHLCGHASGEPEEYVKTAIKRGITEMCFTDHAPAPDGYDPVNRMVIDKYPEYEQIVSSLQDKYPDITILFGIEADYYEGCENFLKEWLLNQDMDLVIGSVHYIEEWGFDNPNERAVWDSVDVTNTWKEYFRLLGKLADTGMYDIVGHLDLPKKFRYSPSDSVLSEIAKSALDKIAEAGMAIELNSSGLRRPVKEIYPSLLLLSMARERGIPICFGSDSHEPHLVGCAFEASLELAREAGYTKRAIFRKRNRSMVDL